MKTFFPITLVAIALIMFAVGCEDSATTNSASTDAHSEDDEHAGHSHDHIPVRRLGCAESLADRAAFCGGAAGIPERDVFQPILLLPEPELDTGAPGTGLSPLRGRERRNRQRGQDFWSE